MEEKKNLNKNEQMISMVKPMSDYKNIFVLHCKELKPRISTGIWKFDNILNGGLANELYIMGAETSTGKSAFLMSIAQKVAESGIDVLYFALEMGKDEFVARGISTISYEEHRQEKNQCVTAANILYWQYDHVLKDFAKMPYHQYERYTEEYFRRYGEHLHIIESGLQGLTVKEIANMATLHKKRVGKQIVVFIDYLQIIKADPNDRTQSDRKTKMDVCVTTLKTLASQIGMPVVTISSIGRNNYGDKINTASYKESGDLEYTGGVLLGWDWRGVTDVNRSKTEEIAAEKAACKQRGYRKMRLSILKYRNAERDSEAFLKYYPAYNYFEEDLDFNAQKKSEEKITDSLFDGNSNSKNKPIKVMDF